MKHDGRSPDPRITGRSPAPEVDEELAHHLEQRVREYQARGMSLEEARAAAIQRMGDLATVRAECTHLLDAERRTEGRRARLQFSWLDFKLGFRMLVRYPGLTLIGSIAMAFGVWVGACTFEMSRQWLRPSLALEDGDRIVGIQLRNMAGGGMARRVTHDFLTWRTELESLTELSAFSTSQATLVTEDVAPEPVEVAEITASGFDVTRVPALLGRHLVAADESPAAPPVIVISHDVWQERFGGDPGVIGRAAQLGNTHRTVVGVMPEGFAFPAKHDVWIPSSATRPAAFGSGPAIWMFGRLAEGRSLAEAQTELDHLGRVAAAASPETHEHLRPQVVPYARSILSVAPGEITALRGLNLAVVMLIGLICGNVALLIFARAATRESEIVVRNALGASRGRIIAQLFTEALLLGVIGTAAGLAAAQYGLRTVMFMLEANLIELPYWVVPRLSPVTILYAVALTILGALIAGVVPALRVTRAVGTRLRQAGAGGGGLKFSGFWTVVIVAQVALTVTFPMVAVLIWRSSGPMRSFELGIRSEEYLTARVEPSTGSAAGAIEGESPQAYVTRFRGTLLELDRRLSDESAVVGVTFANRLPRMYHPARQIDVIEGLPALPDSVLGPTVKAVAVGADYFDLMDAPVLAGRAFHAGDFESAERPVIVNQSFVDEVLGGRNAIGRGLRFRNYDPDAPPEPWYQIVGVVRDLGMYHEGSSAGLYHPLAASADGVYLVSRVRGDPLAFASRLRSVTSAVDPTLRLTEVLTLPELNAVGMRFIANFMKIALLLSGMALILSLAGIYAVMSFAVSRRTREIGIRVALGSDARRVLLAVFRRPLAQLAMGFLAGAVLVTILVRSFVGDFTRPMEIGFLVAYGAVVTGVCMLACAVPTWRALRIQPTDALREEA
jgi:putative ABC transport system permease protein